MLNNHALCIHTHVLVVRVFYVKFSETGKLEFGKQRDDNKRGPRATFPGPTVSKTMLRASACLDSPRLILARENSPRAIVNYFA